MSASVEALETLIRKLVSTSVLSEEERQAIRQLPAAIRHINPSQDLAEDG